MASNVLAGSHCVENSGRPCFPASTTQQGQQFSWQHATRHCLGWSATYTARIGKTRWTKPSAHGILAPDFPTSMRGPSRHFMQSWKICWPWVFRFDLEKQSSFVTGMYPIRTVAQAEIEWCVNFLMFLIFKYTGHADLSSLKLDSCVLSDAMVTLGCPAFSSLSYIGEIEWFLQEPQEITDLHIPPPVSHPHLIKYLSLSIFVLIRLLRWVSEVVSETWVPN